MANFHFVYPPPTRGVVVQAKGAGADFVCYVRVHSGPWASWGSHWPQANQRRLEPGDIIRLDYGGPSRATAST